MVRTSGLREEKDDFFSFTLEDLQTLIERYTEFKQQYSSNLYAIKNKHKKPLRAYTVTFKDDPSLFYIAFTENRYKAKGKATMYFRDVIMHPDFIGKEWKKKFLLCRYKSRPELDQYAETKVPIPEVLKLGVTIPCSFCGKHYFTLDDYEKKRCFIVEGEGDINCFTRNLLACYDCYKKLS